MKSGTALPGGGVFGLTAVSNSANVSANQPLVMSLGANFRRRRASSAASDNSHSRNVVIFGTLAVIFGQTIQYVFCVLNETSIGTTRRPLMRSQAARVVRASATPWPSTAASISMLAWLRIGPRKTGLQMPADANHLVQVLQSSSRKRGYFSKFDAFVMGFRRETSWGWKTGKSFSPKSPPTSRSAISPPRVEPHRPFPHAGGRGVAGLGRLGKKPREGQPKFAKAD